MFQPAGCADHNWNPKLSNLGNITYHRGRHGKLHRDIGALKRFVAIDIHARGDGEPILRGKLLDEAPHFSVADDGKLRHKSRAGLQPAKAQASNTAGSNSLKNSRCSACTAADKSSPATTKPRLSADAPCDTMRTLMLPSALKIRAATPGVWRMFSPTMQMIA